MNSSVKMAAPKPVATIVLVLTLNKSFIFFSPFEKSAYMKKNTERQF